MRKLAFFLFAALSFSACSVAKYQSSMLGQFAGQARWSTMTLSLNQNGTFVIDWGHRYTGTWKVGGGLTDLQLDSIINPVVLLESYSLAGTNEDFRVKFINENKVVLLPRGYILKRVK